jgi:hypothetical protein
VTTTSLCSELTITCSPVCFCPHLPLCLLAALELHRRQLQRPAVITNPGHLLPVRAAHRARLHVRRLQLHKWHGQASDARAPKPDICAHRDCVLQCKWGCEQRRTQLPVSLFSFSSNTLCACLPLLTFAFTALDVQQLHMRQRRPGGECDRAPASGPQRHCVLQGEPVCAQLRRCAWPVTCTGAHSSCPCLLTPCLCVRSPSVSPLSSPGRALALRARGASTATLLPAWRLRRLSASAALPTTAPASAAAVALCPSPPTRRATSQALQTTRCAASRS